MDNLQSEYLGLVSTLHIQEQILEINRSHRESDDHFKSPNLESELSARIAETKRRIAVKAIVLSSKSLEVPVHTFKWEWNEKELRRRVRQAEKSLLKEEPKVVTPVMGEKVSKRKLPKITPRKVKIKND